jgi:sec-independent protein translocase protein TatA
MFGLGVPELVVILIVALLIFGPGKLPDLGKFLGKSIREFREALEQHGQDEPSDEPPARKPVDPGEKLPPT